MTPISNLPKLLAHPRKICQALDWHKASGSVLTLCVHRDRLDPAVASHPSAQLNPLSLPPIPVTTSVAGNRRFMSSNVAREVQRIAAQFHVCGVVVHWPVQPEGWCGAHCGLVWFTLEQLLTTEDGALHGTSVCLWNSKRAVQAPEDSWGRSPAACAAPPTAPQSPPHKRVYRSSREQPQRPASDVWNDYCRAQWPARALHGPWHSAGTTAPSSPAARWSPQQVDVARVASPRWTAATAPALPPEPPNEDLF